MNTRNNLSTLMQTLGHLFIDPGLLLLALTHPSAASGSGGDNQRLEFLGDAVLQLCVSEALYARHPQMQEGELTRLRADLVREESLAQAARRFGLGAYLKLDRGEDVSGGRDKASVLADTMEAVIAAAYLDGGPDAARRLCARTFGDFVPTAAEPNWKSLLQELEQAEGRGTPTYHIVAEEGPPHARVFTVEVTLAGGGRACGSGTSKKQAEQHAAKALMEGTLHP